MSISTKFNLKMSINSVTMSATLVAAMIALSGCQNTSPIEQNNTQDSNGQHSTQDKPMSNANNASNKDWITADLLARYHWTLVSAKDNKNQPLTALEAIKNQVVLDFGKQENQDTASFGVGCNQMGTGIDITNNVMKIGDVMSTQMYCDKLNEAESQLGKLMAGTSQLSYQSGSVPVLTQTTSNQATLIWQGAMTATAKYGHEGETIFWAVSHKTEPCAANSGKTCLKVKPITYNDQGIKTHEGDWSLFNGEIEGYTHNGSQDQVLRLKRYVVNPSDVKGKQYAYVLDTVTESEQVK